MNIEGALCRLRALEPEDAERMYAWENDPEVWHVSGTTAPFSRHTLARFIEEQRFDIYQTRQLRLIVERHDGTAVGALDLFDFEPQHRRAGLGILIHDRRMRGRGYASDAVAAVCGYARRTLGLHQLWCGVGATNRASLALFRNAGFTQSGLRRAWLATPDGYEDEVLFQKILDPGGRHPDRAAAPAATTLATGNE